MKIKDFWMVSAMLGAVIFALLANDSANKAQEQVEETVLESIRKGTEYDPTAWMKKFGPEWAECELTEELGPHTHSDNPKEVDEHHKELGRIISLGPPVLTHDYPVYEEATLIGPEEFSSSDDSYFPIDEDAGSEGRSMHWELNSSGQYDARERTLSRQEREQIRRETQALIDRALNLLQVLDTLEEIEKLKNSQPVEPKQQLSPAEYFERRPEKLIA